MCMGVSFPRPDLIKLMLLVFQIEASLQLLVFSSYFLRVFVFVFDVG